MACRQYDQFVYDPVDPRFGPSPQRIYPIPSNHASIQSYELAREPILEFIRQSLQPNYSLTLALRGTSADSAVPTIILSSSNPMGLPSLSGLVPSDLELYVVGGEAKRYGWEMPHDPYYHDPVNCGVSISLQNDLEGAGSFGGYLKDSKVGTLFGFTAGHVIGMDPDYSAVPPHKGDFIVQPSMYDFSGVDTDTERARASHERNRGHLIFGKFYDGISSTIPCPGRPGKMTTVDWGLFTVDNRIGDNSVVLKKGVTSVSGVETLQYEMPVVKVGRTTGDRYGYVNSVKCDVKMGKSGPETCEWVVFGNKGDLFSLPGDSGAWVLHHKTGKLVGHVIGGQEGSRETYISEMTVVLNDISERCKLDLELY